MKHRIYIPRRGKNGRSMIYIRLLPDGTKQEMNRRDFLRLLQEDQEQSVLPDFEGGYVYCTGDAAMEPLSLELCRAAERERKRTNSRNLCKYIRSSVCDKQCENCPYEFKDVRREIDMDETAIALNLADENSDPQEILEQKERYRALYRALRRLSREDRRFILERYCGHMKLDTLAKRYGRSVSVMSRRATRIEKKLRKHMSA